MPLNVDINCAKGKRLKTAVNVVLPPCVQAKIDVCKVTEIYQNEARNKPAISMTVRRAHFEDENKSPDWPGQYSLAIFSLNKRSDVEVDVTN